MLDEQSGFQYTQLLTGAVTTQQTYHGPVIFVLEQSHPWSSITQLSSGSKPPAAAWATLPNLPTPRVPAGAFQAEVLVPHQPRSCRGAPQRTEGGSAGQGAGSRAGMGRDGAQRDSLSSTCSALLHQPRLVSRSQSVLTKDITAILHTTVKSLFRDLGYHRTVLYFSLFSNEF